MHRAWPLPAQRNVLLLPRQQQVAAPAPEQQLQVISEGPAEAEQQLHPLEQWQRVGVGVAQATMVPPVQAADCLDEPLETAAAAAAVVAEAVAM